VLRHNTVSACEDCKDFNDIIVNSGDFYDTGINKRHPIIEARNKTCANIGEETDTFASDATFPPKDTPSLSPSSSEMYFGLSTHDRIDLSMDRIQSLLGNLVVEDCFRFADLTGYDNSMWSYFWAEKQNIILDRRDIGTDEDYFSLDDIYQIISIFAPSTFRNNRIR